MNYTSIYHSPLGELILVSNETALLGVWMQDQKYYMHTISGDTIEDDNQPIIVQTKSWLDSYFNGGKPNIKDLKLQPEGSDFRKLVWDALCEIPYGEVVTYGDIAQMIAKRKGLDKMSAQAVGGAVGHNPIGIIIPCHRVVGKDHSLTGYGGGMKRKVQLLEHEGIDMNQYTIPTKGTAI